MVDFAFNSDSLYSLTLNYADHNPGLAGIVSPMLGFLSLLMGRCFWDWDYLKATTTSTTTKRGTNFTLFCRPYHHQHHRHNHQRAHDYFFSSASSFSYSIHFSFIHFSGHHRRHLFHDGGSDGSDDFLRFSAAQHGIRAVARKSFRGFGYLQCAANPHLLHTQDRRPCRTGEGYWEEASECFFHLE